MTEAVAVRAEEALPREALRAWLGARLAGGETADVLQFPAGHSNLTYLVRTHTPAAEYVLRRPPLGPVASRAHDVTREFRVLEALAPHFVPAPRPVALCEDPGVIGAPFFVMERRRGIVPRRGLPAEFAGAPEAAARMSAALVDGLAALHRIDVHATGLSALGRPAGFLERQVAGWSARWRAAVTQPVPAMDPVMDWLAAERPASAAATVVHQDFKLDNLMFHPQDPGRITAVLDWEMATVGDPLADLGLTLTYWSLPEARAVAGLDEGAGWWSRDRLLSRYREATGLELDRMLWYEVLGIFKLATIVQQIYARYARGQTRDVRFAELGRTAARLAERAREMIQA